MYTKGEYDTNLQRIMGRDIPNIRENLGWVAQYMELHTQLEFLKELKNYPDLYSEEEYKRDLKLLAERANFKFDKEES